MLIRHSVIPPISPTDDAELVQSVGAGSADALGALYERYAPTVMGLAYRLTGSVSDAEDAVHDIFLGLPEALKRYEERGSFESWLKRVTVRLVLTRQRARVRRREIAYEDAPEPSRSSHADKISADITLERGIAALPDSLRDVFVLKEIEGYSHAEVATLLGITAAASEVRLCRAVRALRHHLREVA
ncbi:MAG: sigma-70 family RNA polymerase sigma factor [Anaerolineae bacterium]|nr:sigma-70 family RNA polymerase sigma factor [Gemmatimonadaceae bacterium]